MAATVALVLAAAGVLAVGTTRIGEPADDTVYSPAGHAAAGASEQMAESLPDSAGLSAVTVLFRGDATSAAGLEAIERATANAAAAIDRTR